MRVPSWRGSPMDPGGSSWRMETTTKVKSGSAGPMAAAISKPPTGSTGAHSRTTSGTVTGRKGPSSFCSKASSNMEIGSKAP